MAEQESGLEAVARSDRVLDALAAGARMSSVDPVASMLGGWRDEIRRAPDTQVITLAEAAAALAEGKKARPRHRFGVTVVGTIAAALLCLGGFGAVVFGAGPGDPLYGLRTMLFGAPTATRGDQVALAAQTELQQVQQLVQQGQWQQAQDKLAAISTTVQDVSDAQRKQQLINQWNSLTVKVVSRDPNATLSPGAPPPILPGMSSPLVPVPGVAPGSTTRSSATSSAPPPSATSSSATSPAPPATPATTSGSETPSTTSSPAPATTTTYGPTTTSTGEPTTTPPTVTSTSGPTTTPPTPTTTSSQAAAPASPAPTTTATAPATTTAPPSATSTAPSATSTAPSATSTAPATSTSASTAPRNEEPTTTSAPSGPPPGPAVNGPAVNGPAVNGPGVNGPGVNGPAAGTPSPQQAPGAIIQQQTPETVPPEVGNPYGGEHGPAPGPHGFGPEAPMTTPQRGGG